MAANAPISFTLSLGLCAFLFLLVAAGWGRLLASLTRVTLTVELQTILGVALMAYGLALPVMLFGVSILLPAGVLLIGALGLLLNARQIESGAALFVSLTAAAGFALIWSLEGSFRFSEFISGGPYRLWLDDFIQAGTIAELGEIRSAGRGSTGLADVPGPLYHAAGHAIGALAVRLIGIEPLAAISGFWVPLGIFVSALGFFALGRALAGIAGGALSLLFLALLPDAAAYGLQQGFLSFHWLMEASPGSLYGLPVALASIALLAGWIRHGGVGTLILSFLLLCAVFMLRAHIFVWLLIPWFATFWLALPWPAARFRWALLALGSFMAPPALLFVGRAEVAELGLTNYVTRYLYHLHVGYSPNGYEGLYLWLLGMLGPWLAAPFGLVLALLGMGGVWLLTFLIGLAMAARRNLLETLDVLPIALLVWAMTLMLLAPTPFHSDFTDFRQRGFVIVFAILLIWSARFILLFWPAIGRPVSNPLPLALGACLALFNTMQWMPQAKQPRMASLAPFRENQLRPGLAEAARWINAQALRDESFLLAGQRPDTVWFDDATIIIGASGVPAWLSRPGLYRLSGPPRSDIAAERLARADAIQAEPDQAQAFAQLRAAGVAFYLTLTSAPPAWDPEAKRADLRTGEILGWRVPRQ